MKSKLLCLGLAVIAVGCNEKVDPSLDDGNAATSETTAVPPSQYIFKIENTSALPLNYNLHRTGVGNSYTACAITSSSALTGAKFELEGTVAMATQHDSKLYDITCFMEAEELALYFSGLKFQLTASQNTCEYIGYSPYSYYKYRPGDSSKSATSKYTATPGADCSSVVVTASSGNIGCGTEEGGYMVDDTAAIPAGSKNIFTLETACAFDYTASGGPNCDTGTITYTQHNFTEVNNDGVISTTYDGSVQKTHSCGGAIANCIGGPIKLIPALTGTRGTQLTETVRNEAYSRDFEFTGGIAEMASGNRDIVNFRRDLSARDIDFVSSEIDYNAGADTYSINASFDVGAYDGKKNYDPKVMDYYSNGKDGFGAVNASLATAQAAEAISLGYTATPLAADPFLGYGSSNRTNPFYTFLCLDRAFEVKARIRLVVRDWDRVFYPDPSSVLDNFALISDIADGDDARIDNPTGIESDTDSDEYNHYNDFMDWDDLLFMERDDTTRIWNPANGYFKASNFFN